jgi:transcription initiation factor IIF auxiliary subunit
MKMRIEMKKGRIIGQACACLTLLFSSSISGEQEIRLANNSIYTGDGRYDWTVYVKAEEPVLDRIEYVEYMLHPTFPEPVRRIDTRENDFSLSANGWGEFLILARVFFKNGESVNVEHWLSFASAEEPQDEEEPERLEERGLAVENTAQFLKGDRWEWTIYIAAPDDVLGQIECVIYNLHPAYPEPRRKICEKSTSPGHGFPLTDTAWEPFDIAVEIRFSDGPPKFLEHRLKSPFSNQKFDLIALRSVPEGMYVRAGVGGESYLAAASERVRNWEIFRMIRLEENMVALQSAQNRKFVRAGVGDESFLAAVSNNIESWETFRLYQLEGHMIALQSVQSGAFVRAGVGERSNLAAASSHIDMWEMFDVIYLEETPEE